MKHWNAIKMNQNKWREKIGQIVSLFKSNRFEIEPDFLKVTRSVYFSFFFFFLFLSAYKSIGKRIVYECANISTVFTFVGFFSFVCLFSSQFVHYFSFSLSLSLPTSFDYYCYCCCCCYWMFICSFACSFLIWFVFTRLIAFAKQPFH